jgi:hypothetical protein
MLQFPCFRTDARFDPGMSGGPVFNNSTGHLCGVICSSMPGTTNDAGHLSYASSLWPVTGTQIDANETQLEGGQPWPLMRLFQNRTIVSSDLQQIRVVQSEDGQLQVYAAYDAREWDDPEAG